MVKAVDEEEAWLRRYADGSCPDMPGDHSYHNAQAHIGRIPLTYSSEGYIESVSPSRYKGDERWPTRCSCGYEFIDSDRWQVLGRRLYENDSGERRILDIPWRAEAGVPTWEPGAMFDAYWLDKWGEGPDGLHLSVLLPPDGHVWHVDGPSSSGGGWTRSGTPPAITASPSILTPRYHGFLQNGVLTDSLPDRPL